MLNDFVCLCRCIFRIYFIISPVVYLLISCSILSKVGVQRQGRTAEEAAVAVVAEEVVEVVVETTILVIGAVSYLVLVSVLVILVQFISAGNKTNNERKRYNFGTKDSN
ncbi:uncharacterized protein LOC117208926 [Bombus bifarius]|uniref:Uncharacterized protein LOC117208926 n=1 Tax=Bombus bifarius TaxID=103933 RepID=A0A6P8MVU7_9HYME|nr:uncharacterized protein LOC117166337 [Bombus vancouverensis nearcticus]XP_033306345.1 uncharacterized protein LOC117208926 [Bombus bifarius]